MILTPRVLDILRSVAHYGVLTAGQIRALCFPNIHSDGSNVRSRLREMVSAKLLNRTRMQVVNPMAPMAAPAYYSTPLGLDTLIAHTGNETYRLVCTRAPQWQNLMHYVSVADLHIVADRAIAAQSYAVMERWINEFDVVNGDATDPAERFTLYTLIRQTPRLVCVPDAGFALKVNGFRKAFYCELERATSPTHRVAAEKSPGYAALRDHSLHKRHFPEALDDFSVLFTAPDARWRDQLRKAFATKERPDLYRFAALPELTPDSFFFGRVWHPCSGEATALVKQPVAMQTTA